MIEAHLVRAAHAEGYLLLSSNPSLLANQPALQFMALNLEPPKLFIAE